MSIQRTKPALQPRTSVDPASAQIYRGRYKGRSVWYLTFRLPGCGRHVSHHATEGEAYATYSSEVMLWERVR